MTDLAAKDSELKAAETMSTLFGLWPRLDDVSHIIDAVQHRSVKDERLDLDEFIKQVWQVGNALQPTQVLGGNFEYQSMTSKAATALREFGFPIR